MVFWMMRVHDMLDGTSSHATISVPASSATTCERHDTDDFLAPSLSERRLALAARVGAGRRGERPHLVPHGLLVHVEAASWRAELLTAAEEGHGSSCLRVHGGRGAGVEWSRAPGSERRTALHGGMGRHCSTG
jgi:hypothetical protein